MGKDKRMTIEQNKRDLTFYYELIGVSTILLSLVALARLGIVGYYIMMAFRIVFGDWYFAFLLGLLLFGIYCLFKHQPLNIKNMRSIGVILLMISILTFSHFPMHKYISQFGSSYLKMTFSLYLDYLKNYQDGMIVGGGIIGTVFFYLFYTLFSSAGTLVIVFFISMVGVSFSFNKTIGESLALFKKILKCFFSIFTRFGKTLKYGIEVKNLGNNKSNKATVEEKNKLKNPKMTMEMLTNSVRNNYIITEEKHAASLKKTIMNVLNNMNVFYQSVNYLVAEHVTTIKIDTVTNINLDKLYLKLKAILTERFLITKDIDSPKIKIEIDNVDVNSVYLKTMLNMQEKYLNNLKLPIGIDTNNELVELDFLKSNSVLIINENVYLVYQTFLGYMMLLDIKLTKIAYEYYLFDLNNEFKELSGKSYYLNFLSAIEQIKKDVDYRLYVINNNNCNDVIEYNRKNKEKLPIKFLFILNLETLINNKKAFEDLLYILQVGKQCGYYFIVHFYYSELLTSSVDSLFNVRLVGKSSGVSGEKYVGIDPGNYLYDEEAFFMYRDELVRFSVAIAREEEIKKFTGD